MKKLYFSLFTLFFIFSGIAQTSLSYTVESIPYQDFEMQIDTQFNLDDIYSEVFDLPFDFNFYDQFYNSIVIGSNGSIVFDASFAGEVNPWQLIDAETWDPDYIIPAENLAFPAIFGVFHDMNNSLGAGGIYYGVTGTSPNRKYHILFDNMPQYVCEDLLSTSMIVLHETTGIIDVYINNKEVCADWNDGNAVVGLNMGIAGIAPPERNTSVWEASEEAWRFTPATSFNVAICDEDNDGTEFFDLSAYANNVLTLFNTDEAESYVAFQDEAGLPLSTEEAIAVYAGDNTFIMDVDGDDYAEFDLTISVIDCEADSEDDGIPNGMEDVNGNGNLGDDDTDGDGIPNYLDDDDDGDLVPSNLEVVFNNRSMDTNTSTFMDTDEDGIPDHIDMDDDGDGILTSNEDYNANGDPTDDDLNNNGTPDYLDAESMAVEAVDLTNVKLYPNPTSTELNVVFSSVSQSNNAEITIYDMQGRQVLKPQEKPTGNNTVNIDVSKLSSGYYMLVIRNNGLLETKKFVVE